MPKQTPGLSVPIPAAKLAKIDAMAASTAQSRQDLINQAIDQFLAAQAWQVARIHEGLAAAEQGQVLEGEALFASIEREHGWAP